MDVKIRSIEALSEAERDLLRQCLDKIRLKLDEPAPAWCVTLETRHVTLSFFIPAGVELRWGDGRAALAEARP